MNKNLIFRSIPKVDVLLEEQEIIDLINQYDRETVVEVIREQTEGLRVFIQQSGNEEEIREKAEGLRASIKEAVAEMHAFHMKPVINATGTILHTNLGRAPISEAHAERLKEIVTGYSNLEYQLEEGKRGERYSHFEELICKVTGAEAAIAVNNNAAAVLLILGTMTKGKETVISRGELVEIGGKFRIPEVMEQSGSRLVEVGTTNKTHLDDYEDALTDETGALLKVHTSNYKIVGFTESVSVRELAELGRKYKVPVIEDIGSGVLLDLSKYGLTYEPTVQESVRQGADIVSFSGDKLLGGPQAGIIVGKKEYIDRMKKNPLMRAIRIDKFTATALELVFQEYLSEKNALRKIPVMQMILKPLEKIGKAADNLMESLEPLKDYAEFSREECQSQIGGGSLPAERIDSIAVTVKPLHMTTEQLEERLRKLAYPIIVRVANDKVYMDMRTLKNEDLTYIAEGFGCILKGEE